MVTASTDGIVKLWDLEGGKPKHLCSQNARVGSVFSLEFCADLHYLVAVGGAEGQVSVWDILTVKEVQKRYQALLEPS